MDVKQAFNSVKSLYKLDFSLKHEQFIIINDLYLKKNVFGILPTSFGKSAKFVLPPLILNNVVSDKTSVTDEQGKCKTSADKAMQDRQVAERGAIKCLFDSDYCTACKYLYILFTTEVTGAVCTEPQLGYCTFWFGEIIIWILSLLVFATDRQVKCAHY